MLGAKVTVVLVASFNGESRLEQARMRGPTVILWK